MAMAHEFSRRDALTALAALGIGNVTFQRAAVAAAAQPGGKRVTAEMVKDAEWVAGITLTDDERTLVASRLTGLHRQIATLRETAIGYDVPPAVYFNPVPGEPCGRSQREPVEPARLVGPVARPQSDADLGFLPLTHLAELIRTRQVTVVEAARASLARLKKYDPALLCVVSLTEELALKQAEAADKEIAAGKYRGPLHGIPWVAKDLIAYPGYKTTWGAGHFKDQTINVKATVAERLESAGAVMVAKSTLGALALGDRWFGGRTRNPWNIKNGSSGSSAGTASAVAAGLVAFGLGSETLGSIVSPSTVCGVTGLRPTFGRVSRHGCMALSWTLDKVGPMARNVEDCALVFGAIHGPDGKDGSVIDRPFRWPGNKPLAGFRVGYLEGTPDADLKVLKGLGLKLESINLPQSADGVIDLILDAECATAFDDITRAGVKTDIGPWPATFRTARFITAVDYLRAQRARTLLMREMAKLFETIDAYACPAGMDLVTTNLTGHPTLCLPNGFTADGLPTALTFTGRLFGETDLLTLAKAYQDATGHNRKRPPEEKWVPETKSEK